MLIAEMTAYYKSKNMTLFDAMNSLYEKYGYYKENVISATFEGLDGMDKIKNLMKNFKENPPKTIGSANVTEIINYNDGIDGLPKADVLRFELDDDTTIFVRPSGTEPKIKGYMMVKGNSHGNADELIAKYTAELKNMLK